MRGYLAMLSVHPDWRKRGIGTSPPTSPSQLQLTSLRLDAEIRFFFCLRVCEAKKLLHLSIEEMKRQGADEVVLETEADNEKSLGLYERMGFWREKRLWRFYLNVSLLVLLLLLFVRLELTGMTKLLQGKDAFRLILPLKPPPLPPLPPKIYTPPPLVRVEDDFGSASFLSSETFVPSDERSTPLQLSHALQGLAQRVDEEDEEGEDGDVTILPPLARLGGARVAGGDEPDNESEPDDIELDESLPPTSTMSLDRTELLTPLEVEGEEDEDLEGLEVSEEDEGEWKAAGRTLSESLTEVNL